MFGVMRLTLDDDEESMRGDDDFFSVASTMPFVAIFMSAHISLEALTENSYTLNP